MGLFKKTPDGLFCPLIKDTCIKEKCMFWTKLVGKNPQSDQDIDQWGCAIQWLPILLVENSQMTRQTSSTVQNFRNDVHQVGAAIAEESVKRREIEERRLEVDQRLLELGQVQKPLLLKSGKIKKTNKRG